MVNAQLIDTGNATQLWSDHLEADPAQATQDAPGLVALLTRRVRNALCDRGASSGQRTVAAGGKCHGSRAARLGRVLQEHPVRWPPTV